MGEGRGLEEGVVGGDEEAKVKEEEMRVELFCFFDWNIFLGISLSMFHWLGGGFHSGGNN